jgi:hypothetical protein
MTAPDTGSDIPAGSRANMDTTERIAAMTYTDGLRTGSESDYKKSDRSNAGMSGTELSRAELERGQSWLVLIRKGYIRATVKVLDFDERTVVLRAVDNVDLMARFDFADVDFISRADQ